MPRANPDQRMVRDRLVFDLWCAGHPLRGIGRHPGVRLSLAAVQRVLRRETLQVDTVELLEGEYESARRAARAGDVRAARRCRLIQARLAVR